MSPAESRCNSASTKQADGLVNVNDFLTRIERVHVNSELSQDRVKQAVASLKTLIEFDFLGDTARRFGLPESHKH